MNLKLKRRRKLHKLLLILALSLASRVVRGENITATITYNFTSAVACSATVSTNCMTGFGIGTVANGAFSLLATAPLPSTMNGTITLPPVVFSYTGVYGSIQFCAVAAVKDLNGSNLNGVPYCPPTGIVVITPGQPTAFTATGGN